MTHLSKEEHRLQILDAIRAFYQVYQFSPSYATLKVMTGLRTSSFENYLADLDRSGAILRTKINGRRTNIKLLKSGKQSSEMVRKAKELRVDVLRGRKSEIAALNNKQKKLTFEERIERIVAAAGNRNSAGVDVMWSQSDFDTHHSLKCIRVG